MTCVHDGSVMGAASITFGFFAWLNWSDGSSGIQDPTLRWGTPLNDVRVMCCESVLWLALSVLFKATWAICPTCLLSTTSPLHLFTGGVPGLRQACQMPSNSSWATHGFLTSSNPTAGIPLVKASSDPLVDKHWKLGVIRCNQWVAPASRPFLHNWTILYRERDIMLYESNISDTYWWRHALRDFKRASVDQPCCHVDSKVSAFSWKSWLWTIAGHWGCWITMTWLGCYVEHDKAVVHSYVFYRSIVVSCSFDHQPQLINSLVTLKWNSSNNAMFRHVAFIHFSMMIVFEMHKLQTKSAVPCKNLVTSARCQHERSHIFQKVCGPSESQWMDSWWLLGFGLSCDCHMERVFISLSYCKFINLFQLANVFFFHAVRLGGFWIWQGR